MSPRQGLLRSQDLHWDSIISIPQSKAVKRCLLSCRRLANFAHNRRQSGGWNRIYSALLLLFIVTSVPYFLAYAYYRSILDETILLPSLKNDILRDKYTIVILSQPRRLKILKTIVGHYSRCPSVDSIVIIWGDNAQPLTKENLPDVDIPLRIRTETIDSLNNRFKPDPLIATEAVFSLDDDTLMLCQDVENGFEEWKLNRNRLVGFFPRLVVENLEENFTTELGRKGGIDSSKSELRYLNEREVYKRGEYNIILTVGMFYNAALMEEYWKPDGFPAAGREVVHKNSNCEDILMNYIAAGRVNSQLLSEQNNSTRNSSTAEEPAVKYVRPRRRLDLSKLSSIGISHQAAAHLAKRERCLSKFSEYIRSHADAAGKYPALPLVENFDWEREAGKSPLCWLPLLGCVYL